MKICIEKIIKREDGSRVKIGVSLREIGHGRIEYKEDVDICAKGKRTWNRSFDRDALSYRRLSMEAREAHVITCNRQFATEAEILTAKIELWESLKPAGARNKNENK